MNIIDEIKKRVKKQKMKPDRHYVHCFADPFNSGLAAGMTEAIEVIEPLVRTAEELAGEIEHEASEFGSTDFAEGARCAVKHIRSRLVVPVSLPDAPFALPVTCELGTDESGVDYTPGEDINIIRDASDKQICHVFDAENSTINVQYIVSAINGQAPVSGNATEGVLREVAAERIKQTIKFGIQRHDAFKWCAILGEEYGEACQAAVQADYEGKPHELYRKELLHAAAVAVQAIESYDRDGFAGQASDPWTYLPELPPRFGPTAMTSIGVDLTVLRGDDIITLDKTVFYDFAGCYWSYLIDGHTLKRPLFPHNVKPIAWKPRPAPAQGRVG